MKTALAGASLIAFAVLVSPAANAQAAYESPRTSWGVPDIQGVWSNASVTKLTRPAGVDKLVLTPTEAAAIESKDFNNARQCRPTRRKYSWQNAMRYLHR